MLIFVLLGREFMSFFSLPPPPHFEILNFLFIQFAHVVHFKIWRGNLLQRVFFVL